MSKRPRSDSPVSNMENESMVEDVASMANPTDGGAAVASGSGGGGGGAGAGAPLFPPGRPLKGINKHTKTFTKKFYFKIYANDWLVNTVGTSPSSQTAITHFATYIPYQALCMYLSPQEYMEIVRGSHYCKVRDAKFELKFKAIRTPFDANSTDAAEANGNLQFEIQRWDGLETMLPFQTLDFEGRSSAVVTPRTDYTELITRLYGKKAFSHADAVEDNVWPATMRERGLSWRPTWIFPEGGFQQTSSGPMYRTINQYISSLPVGEYVTDSMNTNMAKTSDGYCFNKVVKPKNGLISFASSAASTTPAGEQGRRHTRINTKIRFQDTVMLQTSNPKVGSAQYESLFGGGDATPLKVVTDTLPGFAHEGSTTGTQVRILSPGTLADNNSRPIDFWRQDGNYGQAVAYDANAGSSDDSYGFGYNNGPMNYYSVANLENYTMFSSRNDPPIHHMESMCIGIVPKTNSDNSIVKATAEFECTTSITIDCEDTHPTYIQCAYANGSYVDNYFTDPVLYGGRWQHNELDVCLKDNKYWNGDYGLAAKPLFREYDIDTPLL